MQAFVRMWGRATGLQWVLAGVYCWAKFGWNLGCYACRNISPSEGRAIEPLPVCEIMKLSTKPEARDNHKAVRGGPSYGQENY